MKAGKILLFAMALLSLTSCRKKAEETVVPVYYARIGTGSVSGVYYPTGKAISKIVNKKTDVYNLKLQAESTGGSVYNVNELMAGNLEFGIVQSDRQAQAFFGEAEWAASGPQVKLRALFSIHHESVTILAGADTGIESIEDLAGKTVNIGNPGSGNRGNAIDALENAGIDWETDITAEGMNVQEAARMLQERRIDAYFYTVGHPSGSFKESTSGGRKVRFIPITGIEDLLEKHTFYTPSEIPVHFYPNALNSSNVPTYGVRATLCTSSDVPEEAVYALTREIFENFDEFKTLHPSFGTLTRRSMLEGLTAPLHKGAEEYFREAGLR